MPPSEATLRWSETRERALARWKGLALPEELPPTWTAGWRTLTGLGAGHAEDWCLTRAAEEGNAAARRIVDALLSRLLTGWMAQQRFPGELEGEALQRARRALFGEGAGRGKLSEYEGRGPLEGFLRVVSVRLALNVLRDARAEQRGEVQLEEDSWLKLELPGNPEVALLRREHRQLFKAAFERAVLRLEDRDRVLLGLRFRQALDVESIARVYQVHRVTMARWLAAARAALDGALREELRTSKFSEGETAEAADWLSSQPDLSLSRLFGAGR